MESNLKPVQQLGILMAMQKMVKAKTDEVRRQVEADMNARFAEDGIDRQRLVLDGEEVGKVSLKVKEECYEVVDREAFFDWLFDNGQLVQTHAVKKGCEEEVWSLLSDKPWLFECEEEPKKEFAKTFERLGDSIVVSGTDVIVPGVVPAKAKPNGIVVTGCKPQQVAPIVARLGGLDALLLGDADESKRLTP